MPGPARGRLEAAVTLNATCLGCHPEEAAQWKTSRHHQASTNAAFRKGFALEPKTFCSNCHAPESRPDRPVPAAVSEMGVSCVTCHVTEEGWVLAAPLRDPAPRPAAEAAHKLRRSEAFAHSAGCAGCHEFRFPGVWGNDDESFMQTTVREHARAPAAGGGCASCHMPMEHKTRSHSFSQVRDAQFLAETLHATAEKIGEGLTITLSQPHAGHGFPTGDVYRRLEVGCELRDGAGNVTARDTQYLTRHFGTHYGRWELRIERDDRVFEEPRVVVLEACGDVAHKAANATWWVSLQRVLQPETRDNSGAALVDSEVKIHSGVVPWQSK
jgi:hypothetical protein